MSKRTTARLQRKIRLLVRLGRVLRRRGALRESLAWGLNDHSGRPRANPTTRKDRETIAIQDGVAIDVFHKDLPNGRGPSLSLFILTEEVLRFDCFGPRLGHMHAAFFLPDQGTDRLFLPEGSAEAQIDRAYFEVTRNLGYYQSRLSCLNARRVKIDGQALEAAAQRAQAQMKDWLQSSAKTGTNALAVPVR